MQNQERLIDANLFRKRCEQRKTSSIPKGELLWILDHQPTVEAIRVVHGRWVLDEAWAGSNGGDRHVCSVCNDYYTLEANSLFYCPRCGAKMNEIEHPEHGSFCSIGVGTIESLQRCYVYCEQYINKEAFCELLNEYYSHDKEYTYKEIRDWVDMQYTWYPVVLDGRATTLMVNKDGKFADMYTKKPQYGVQHNVCKIKWQCSGKSDKIFHLCFFEWNRVENGRLVKTQRKMTDVLKASLPEDLYIARVEDMKRKRLIGTSL